MKVLLSFNQYSPRLVLWGIYDIPEPQKGDTILIPLSWFSQVAKVYREKVISGIWFDVTGRHINCCFHKGAILVLKLELSEKNKLTI